MDATHAYTHTRRFYFDKLWDLFDDIDTDDDRRIELHEFKAGLQKLGFNCTDAEYEEIFDDMDGNDGGKVSQWWRKVCV